MESFFRCHFLSKQSQCSQPVVLSDFDFFQTGRRFWKRARSCDVRRGTWAEAAAQTQSRSPMGASTLRHQSTPRGTRSTVKPCGGGTSTWAKALARAHRAALSRGIISLALELVLLYTVSVTGTDGWFLCRQETDLYCTKSDCSICPHLHDRDKFPKESA